MTKVTLADAFATITTHWDPKVAGNINSMQVKLAKFKGAFDWHHHETEDEFFLVVKGRMRMAFHDREEELSEGEFIIVPHGTPHRPEAITEECHVLMVEPATTLNTGTEVTARTVAAPTSLKELR